MKWGWAAAIVGLFLLSKNSSQPVATPAGGMSPVVPLGGAVAPAVNSSNGQTVFVAQPLATTVQGAIGNATSFAIDPGDEAFAMAPPIGSATTNIVPTAPSFQNPDTRPGAWPGLQPGVIVAAPVGSTTDTVPVISSSPANPAPGLNSLSSSPGTSISASPLPAVISQIPGAGDVPTGNTTSTWSADGSVLLYYMEYRRPDGTTYKVPFDPFSGITEAPPQAATTPLGAAANANPPVNPMTGRIDLGGDNV